MELTYWNQRQTLVPDYKIDNNQEEIIKTFEQIKAKAIILYDLQGLTDEEIEESLFQIYKLQQEYFKNDIDKIVLLEYTKSFLNNIGSPLTQMLKSVIPQTEFKYNQKLFKEKNRLVALNKSLTTHILGKYFCEIKDNTFINKLTSQAKQIEDQTLIDIDHKQNNLFEEINSKNLKIRARHYQKENNYNINYWSMYIQKLNIKYNQLQEYFKEKEKDLEEFQTIANLYYLYITYYKMTKKKNKMKTK